MFKHKTSLVFAAVVAVGVVAPTLAFANDTNNNLANTEMGAFIGGAYGAVVGGAAGAAGGYVRDLQQGIQRNEETYREGTDQWERTHEDYENGHNNNDDDDSNDGDNSSPDDDGSDQ
jgi:hypothetical protein